MIKQHKRRFTRAIGSIIIYALSVIFLSIRIMDANFKTWINILLEVGMILIGIAVYLRTAFKGTFNTVTFSREGVEIKGLNFYNKVFWHEVSSIRLLSEELDINHGLEEHYYCIYYSRQGEENSVKLSYNNETDSEIRRYYKK